MSGVRAGAACGGQISRQSLRTPRIPIIHKPSTKTQAVVAARSGSDRRGHSGQTNVVIRARFSAAANATARLNCIAVPRTVNDEYELFVERKIGDVSKRYQFPFKLRADK